jgi:hypothetical protein
MASGGEPASIGHAEPAAVVAVMPLVALGHEDEAAALEPTHYDWQLRRMRPLVEEIGPERSRRQAQEAATPALE